jgi:hypothetical protein
LISPPDPSGDSAEYTQARAAWDEARKTAQEQAAVAAQDIARYCTD